jgi:pimeloyl-ACP methyl ester carboxylesterase
MSRPTPKYLESLRAWGFTAPGAYDAAAVEASFGDDYATLADQHGGGDPTDRDRLLRQISMLWLTVPTYTEARLATIADPVLVIAGDRDELAVLDEQERLFRSIPGAELGIVPGSPHGAASRAVFWSLVEDFLARRLGDPGS